MATQARAQLKGTEEVPFQSSSPRDRVYIQYKIVQPQKRTIVVYQCDFYETDKRWTAGQKTAAAFGIFAVLIFGFGVWSWLTAGTEDYKTLLAVGGGIASVMALLHPLMSWSDSFDVYRAGSHIGGEPEANVSPWHDVGEPSRIAVGQADPREL